jgi:uncharacterized protein YggE
VLSTDVIDLRRTTMRIAHGICLVSLLTLVAGSAWLATPYPARAQNPDRPQNTPRSQLSRQAGAADRDDEDDDDDQDNRRSQKPDRTVSVTGEGETRGAPDTAHIQLGVVTESESAQTAVERNNQAMAQLLSVLQARGIPEVNVQTTSFNVSPQYRHEPGRESQTPRIVGYQVTNQVQVKLTELDKMGGVLDAVVQVGANQIHGIQFSVDDDEQLTDDALRMAMNDARRKAELLAAAAGSSLGRVVEIRYGSPGGPIPMPMRRTMMADAMAQVPIATGEETLSARVEVVYELVD